MNNESTFEMLSQAGIYVGIGLIALAILMIIGYFVRLMTLGEFKDKYDFINKNEINALWRSTVIIIIGGVIWVNATLGETEPMWFFVKLFVSAMLALIVGVVVQNVLRF